MGKSIESTITQGKIVDARGFYVQDLGPVIQSTTMPNHASKFRTDSIASAQFLCLDEQPTYAEVPLRCSGQSSLTHEHGFFFS
jgi:hypothetical protein